jgi:6-phosphogluconolactonase (cycloisomerase 2 family)
VTPDGSHVWVTSLDNNTISIIPTAGGSPQYIDLGSSVPEYVAFTPDGDYAYVAVSTSPEGSINVYSTGSTASLSSTVTIPRANVIGVAVAPNGTYAYATSNTGADDVDGYVDVIQTSNPTTIYTDITSGIGVEPWGIAVSPDSKSVYVMNGGDGTVSVITVGATFAVSKVINVTSAASGSDVAFTPDGGTVYISSISSASEIAAINTATYGVTTVTADSYGSGIYAFGVAVGPSPLPIAYISNTGTITGDFNGDGNPDFAVLGSTSATIYLGNGSGGFISTPHTYTYPNSWAFGTPVTNGSMVLVGDFNADGKTDFALVTATEIYGFLSNGDGTFSAQSAPMPHSWDFGSPPSASYTPVVGDLNGDGKTDFALVSGTAVFTFISAGNGTFNSMPSTTPYYYPMPNGWDFGSPPSASYTPVVGDLNGDGKTDFALVSGTAVFTFLSEGSGNYNSMPSTTPYYYPMPNGWDFGSPPSADYTAVVGDFDGDGNVDFVLVGGTAIFTFLSQGNGTYNPVPTSSPYYYPMPHSWDFGSPPSASYTAFAGYINVDGDTDFALIKNTKVFTFLSNGAGAYSVPITTSPYDFTIPNSWSLGSPPSASYTAVSVGSIPMFILTGSSTAYTLLSNGDGTYTVYQYTL